MILVPCSQGLIVVKGRAAARCYCAGLPKKSVTSPRFVLVNMRVDVSVFVHVCTLSLCQRAIQVDGDFTYAYTLCGHEYVANEDFDKVRVFIVFSSCENTKGKKNSCCDEFQKRKMRWVFVRVLGVLSAVHVCILLYLFSLLFVLTMLTVLILTLYLFFMYRLRLLRFFCFLYFHFPFLSLVVFFTVFFFSLFFCSCSFPFIPRNGRLNRTSNQSDSLPGCTPTWPSINTH